MLLTTTPAIGRKQITQYFGIVPGETIIGANAGVGVDLDKVVRQYL